MIPSNSVRSTRLNSSRGFTIIEVLIVIVVVGILASIALPGYQNSMQKSRRADAKSALLDAANRQEQFMLDRGSYTADLGDLGFGDAPYLSQEEHYTIAAAACGGGTIDRCYLLTAAPRSGSPQEADGRCTQFRLSSNGSKAANGSDASNCW